jgi:hypothetical protein
MKANKLKVHCRNVHAADSKALRQGETPVNPIWMNWKELTLNYHDVKP